LQRAEYPCNADLVISIDGGGSNEVAKVADELKWPVGKKEITLRDNHMGLREHILACGDLSEHYGSVIVLEDDLYVSPMFYRFALQASAFYADRPEIGGISLHRYRLNRSTDMLFEPMTDGTDVFFMQYACSWGQLWTSGQWKAFRQWYSTHANSSTEPQTIPEHVILWPETSWLKYYIKYLVSTGRYFVYPRESLTTAFQETGQHFPEATSRYQVALQPFKREYRFQHLEQSYCVYDAWQTILQDILNRLRPELADYDYAVDFYGIKPLSGISSPYLLTCRKTRAPIIEFGLDMRPVEMNVIENIQGRGIVLARKKDIEPGSCIENHAVKIYPEFEIPRLFRMLRMKTHDKVCRRLSLLAKVVKRRRGL
jgi:hypothetical protein